jgi:competence protein ComEC
MRLAVPLILGIVTGWACNVNALHVSVMFLASGTALLTGLLRSAPRWLFGVGAMLVMFSAGMLSEQGQSMEKEPQWDGVRREYRAELVEMPAVRGTNVKVLAEVSTLPDTLQVARSRGLVYLYFSRSEESGALKAGDILSFKGSIQPPRNQGNPAEFDIEKYYYIKGITGTAFVNDGMWSFADVSSPGLRARALELRAAVVGMYRRLGFEGERLALLSALTLGEKRDFPKELKESYSVAGASHILALSGLHLGILYMLLTMLLPLHRRGLLYRVLRETLVVGLLWGFAFVAGLAPSVVRAAILFTLMSAGRLIGQEVSSVNSLSFAAIAMLLFSPHLLFDVSFQLSFAAVLSILLLAPPLQAIFRVYEHGVLYAYVVNLLILSFVAQAGTLPFVWYYFGVFPLYFLLTNLFVVPLSFVLMLLAVTVWMLAPIAFLQSAVAWLLGAVADVMNWGVEAVASLPGASFSLPPLGLCWTLLLTFAVLLLVSVSI